MSAQNGQQQAPSSDKFDFSSTFRRLKNKRCYVHDVILKGNDRTRESVIQRELRPVMEAETLDELKDGLLASYAQLQNLGIFSSIEFLADAGPDELPNAANVHITVEEKPRLSLHTGTYVQGGEGSVEGTVRLQNAFGLAESIEANAAYGNQTSSTYAITAVQPQWFGDGQMEGRVGHTNKSHQHHSSFSEQLTGASATLVRGSHKVEYELAWRHITHSAETEGFGASKAVRELSGDCLKSAVKHAWSVDTRDSQGMPTAGYALRSRSELAGLGTDPNLLSFARQELEAQLIVPIGTKAALALSMHVGGMAPLGSDWRTRATNICDRFFLGGPGSLRGFRTKGAGPSDERVQARRGAAAAAAGAAGNEAREGAGPRDALGGDILLTGLAALTFELPSATLRMLGIHGHVFVNAGTLLPATGAGAPKSLDALRDSVRASAGAGVVFPTRIGRLELNYCQVLRSVAHDRPKNGFQIGLNSAGL